MGSEFKDLFSTQASDYARFRPTYPQALFRILQEACAEHELAWDVGTGNGQAALALAAYFRKVIATDPSQKQLAEAPAHERVEYRCASAENSGLPDACADLITVAQAFHWFRQDDFFREVKRVGKPGARLAVWCYELAIIDPAVDAVVMELYDGVLGPYWEKERRLVEEGYSKVSFPFRELTAPSVRMGGGVDASRFDRLFGHLVGTAEVPQREG
jgi:ubiquinone/menaquinone biosynthesis C-methylase UbiE